MMCLGRWIECLFLLVMFSAVHHCIFIEQRNEAKVDPVDFKNRSSAIPGKEICDNLTLLLAGPNNKTTRRVHICAQNVTSPSTLNSTNSLDNVPPVFPQKEFNGTKIITCSGAIENTPHSNVSNSNATAAKVECPTTNANVSDTHLNSTELQSNSVITNASDDNLTANTTDINPNNGVNKTDIQNKTGSTDDKVSTINVTNDANITNTNITVTSNLNITNVSNTAVNTNKTDTEVLDLLNSTINCLSPNQIPASPPNITFDETQPIDRDTELIEDGQNTEDLLRNSNVDEEKLTKPGVPLVQGQLAAILAGVFVIISVTAYVGLLSWRRYLENRYGSRQMLVNEDEFNDDLRHFSI